MTCPEATQNPALNQQNQQRTIQQFGYGPEDPDAPNVEFWKDKAGRFHLPIALASLRRCGNCGAYDVSAEMIQCGGASQDGMFGYCRGHHFSCSAYRVCDTWSPGGPVV